MKKLLLLLMMLGAGLAAWSSTVAVRVDGNTFTISRNNASKPEKIYYRTVSLSAIAGVHFTAVEGEYTFPVNIDTYQITVDETALTSLPAAYRYQTGNSRTYRFEVLNDQGRQLNYKDRTITYNDNYKVPTTYLNKSVTDLIYFTDAGAWASTSGNRYLDVYCEATQYGYSQVTDAGYSQGQSIIDVTPLYANSTTLRDYYVDQQMKMYATVGFTQKEEQDGYQYIQILADNNMTYDGNDPNGAVNQPSRSLYKASFILSYDPSGSVMSDDHKQFFPHRYDYVDKAAEQTAGITHYEFDYDNSHLYQQAFRETSLRASTSGSLVLPISTNFLSVRFDAAGSGGDSWDYKNLFARLAIVDAKAPTTLATPVLAGGPYRVGSTFTVSVPFSEIMTVAGTPTLTTSWGTMNYYRGSGTNVLTFQGTITATDGTPLSVTGSSGSIRDLAGNDFAGQITATFNTATAVARYSYANGVLTLNWGEFNKDNKWGADVPAANVTSVTATDEVIFTGDCSEMFSNFTACTSIDLSQVNTDACSNMSSMFNGCANLTTLDVANWNTASVTNMDNLFRGCSGLTTVDVANWNTASVTDMSSMFDGCASLTSLNVANWNTASVTDMANLFRGCVYLTTPNVANWNTASVTDMANLFRNCASLTTLNVANWNTASVTNMSGLFTNCADLTTLNVANWNTSNVTNMDHMFNGCSSLESLNVSNWNTAAVTKMNGMFYGCSSLTSLDLSNWDTDAVTSMASMFNGCKAITTLDLSNWDTDAVTSMASMFNGCKAITTLDLSNWNTAAVTGINSMFSGCLSLTTIYAGSGWSTANATISSFMFANCTSLVGGNGTTFDPNHTNDEYARYDQGADEPGYLTGVFTLTLPDGVTTATVPTLVHGDVNLYAGGTDITLAYSGTPPEGTRFGHFTVDGESVEGDTFAMPFGDSEVGVEFQERYTFDSATGTLALNWGEFNNDNKWGADVTASAVTSVTATSEVSFTGDCSEMFHNFDTCTSMDISNVNTDNCTDMSSMFDGCVNLTTLNVANWNTASVTNMNYMFFGCSDLITVDVANWNTAAVTDMNHMFYNCMKLESLNVSGWNTGSVTDMNSMFVDCWKLTTLDVANWNTDSVTSMNSMFYGCSSLTTLDVANWNTASVTDMYYLFANCRNLSTVDVSNWNTAAVTNMSDMFRFCQSLESLDVSGWNTAAVTNMNSMFRLCPSLESLDLSGWNTGSVTDMNHMFSNCSDLTTIYVGSDWSTQSVNTSLLAFEGCTSLVGGMGTIFDPNHTDGEYARFDQGADEPGYLTGVFTLTLPEDVTTSTAATLTHNGVNYYMGGHDITLAYNGEIPEGTRFEHFTVGGEPVEGDTFAMPFGDSEVGVEFQARYTFDSATGTLTLNWGEFNKNNKWGNDVTPSAVTSVTATSEVSFTGDCSEMFRNFTACTSIDLSQVNTDNCTDMSSMFYYCRDLESLNVSNWNTGSVINMNHMFWNCSSLTTLDISGWNTANVFNMEEMFTGCASLTSLDLSGWNTTSVTNMSSMFDFCPGLTTLDLSNWNTASVTDMSYMFRDCSGLTTLDLSNWNTGSVTNMEFMFRDCSSLESLNVSNWNTAAVTDMEFMFYGCSSLTSLDVSNWNTASVTYMRYMFNGCSSLTSLDVSNWNTASVTNMGNMFYGCSSLESLNVSNWNTASVTNMEFMFYGCSSLTSLDLSGWDTGNVTHMDKMFYGCSSLTTIYAGSGWSDVNFSQVFDGCTSLVGGMGTTFNPYHTNGEYARYDRGADEPGYLTGVFTLTLPDGVTTTTTPTLVHGDVNLYAGGTDITLAYSGEVPEGKIVGYTVNGFGLVGDTFEMLFNDVTVTVVFNDPPRYIYDNETHELALLWGEFNKDNKWGNDVPVADVLSVTATDQVSFTGDCSDMFRNFTACTSIDLSQVNTDACTDMTNMFLSCVSLGALDVSNWNTGNVTDMSGMFTGCLSLESLDVANWNTGSVTNMSGMFNACSGLNSLDIANWDTGNVTNMSAMFNQCSSLTTLDIANWDTGNVTDMGIMFYGCSSLTSLDLSGWDTGNVTHISAMFNTCSSLTTIYAGSGWNAENVTGSGGVFVGCTNLVGGNGTAYDPSHTNGDYARIDRDADKPGYLTGVFTLTLPDGVTTTTTPTLVHGDVNLYAGGTDITLAYSGEVPEGKIVGYTVNGNDFVGDTFEMLFNDVTVTVVFNDPPRYIYDNETHELTLLWGEFNNDNKWGYDVPVADVLSVTATDQVSFTGDCSGMFYNFTACTSIDLSQVNTVDATVMASMFNSCSNLTSLDLSSWDVGNVIALSAMFMNCSSLESLNLTGWDVSNVTYMSAMFLGCTSLTTIEGIEGWNTASVTGTSQMFQNSAISSLDLSGWDVSNVTDMSAMFYNCSNLTTLDVANWNTAAVTDMSEMFWHCSSLTTIYAGSGWSTESVEVSDYMFDECTNLVGGNGTAYDPSHTNGEYARIDRDGYPGYFSGILYAINIDSDLEHGTVMADKQKAILGETVTLTVTVDDGYELESLIVTIADNPAPPSGAPAMKTLGEGIIELTPGDEPGTYTFEMPEAAVDVQATFAKQVPTDINGVINDPRFPHDGRRYNLLGQPVGPDYRGVVIQNGKKFFVR